MAIKFYAMDLHVAIVADVAQIFRKLGHEVDIESLSSHAWTQDMETAKVPGLAAPSILRRLLGRKSFFDIDQGMCDKFFEKNKDRLSAYDGFIVSYPPAFALLFERFNKPVITVSCTRFDFPCLSKERLDWLTLGLSRMHRDGKLIAVANNLLDARICSSHFGFEWEHIASLCNYMEGLIEPKFSELLVWSRDSDRLENEVKSLRGVNSAFSMTERYDSQTIRHHRGVIHLPYQVSIMSAFEHYAQAIPMFVPTPSFLKDLVQTHGLLHEVLFPGSSLSLPEDYERLADFYDERNFKHVVQFESIADLQYKIDSSDLEKVSRSMSEHHILRTKEVHELWDAKLGEIT